MLLKLASTNATCPISSTNLSLVIHLLAFQRQDNADVVRRVIGMLVQPNA